jgi:hypothetical protein
MLDTGFPETAQGDLSLKEQMLIDSVNYDSLKEFLEEGGEPSESPKTRWRELSEKMNAVPALARELAQN